MIEYRGNRYRIYPDESQQALFRKTIGCCRFVYNLCLEQKATFGRRGRSITAFGQGAELKALKAEAPWLKEVPHHALVQTIADLHKAYTNFFEGRAGYPNFKRKSHSRGSFRMPDPKQIKIEQCRIFLPKAGWVRMVMHNSFRGKVKNVAVSMTAGDWHVSILTELEVAEPSPSFGPAVGVDVGVEQPVALSDGTIYAMPRMEEADRRRLAAAQRVFARRRKGSKNRAKARCRIARLQARQARRRLDAAHKITTTIAKNHGRVVMEGLPLAAMTASARGTVEAPGRNVAQKAGLNRSMRDVALGTIRSLLTYKTARRGGRLILVDPAYTSQQCSACGATDADSRVTRSRYVCTSCGTPADADVNAAKNILRRGLSTTGGHPGLACGSSRGGGRKQERPPATAGSSALRGRE